MRIARCSLKKITNYIFVRFEPGFVENNEFSQT